jgi:hypothetical protein
MVGSITFSYFSAGLLFLKNFPQRAFYPIRPLWGNETLNTFQRWYPPFRSPGQQAKKAA